MKILPLPGYGDSRYAKFYNSILGAVVAITVVWLAKIGLGNCVDAPGGGEVCTIGGYDATMISSFVVGTIIPLFVHQSPPNLPPGAR